jgi:hypothetical protein
MRKVNLTALQRVNRVMMSALIDASNTGIEILITECTLRFALQPSERLSHPKYYAVIVVGGTDITDWESSLKLLQLHTWINLNLHKYNLSSGGFRANESFSCVARKCNSLFVKTEFKPN